MESNRDHSDECEQGSSCDLESLKCSNGDKDDKALPCSDNEDEDTATMNNKLFQLNKIVAIKDQQIIELTALNQKLTEKNHKFLQDIIEIVDKNLKEYTKLMNIQKPKTQLVRQKPVQAKMKGEYSAKTQVDTMDCSNDKKMKNCKFFSKQKCKFGDKCIFIHNSNKDSIIKESASEQNTSTTTDSKDPDLSLEPDSPNF